MHGGLEQLASCAVPVLFSISGRRARAGEFLRSRSVVTLPANNLAVRCSSAFGFRFRGEGDSDGFLTSRCALPRSPFVVGVSPSSFLFVFFSIRSFISSLAVECV